MVDIVANEDVVAVVIVDVGIGADIAVVEYGTDDVDAVVGEIAVVGVDVGVVVVVVVVDVFVVD